MVVHTLKRTQLAQAVDDVYVCTDSTEVEDVVQSVGGKVIFTRADHANGTERVAEAAATLARLPGSPAPTFIIDVQGDQPLLNPRHLDLIVRAHAARDDWDVLVPSAAMAGPETPHVVKIVKNRHDRILWMSRSAIPHPFRSPPARYFRHLDSVCFRPEALQRFAQAPPGDLEQVEGVELLRAIEHGFVVGTVVLTSDEVSVNTPADLEHARTLMTTDPIRSEY